MPFEKKYFSIKKRKTLIISELRIFLKIQKQFQLHEYLKKGPLSIFALFQSNKKK
jgi:hypothetical protein